jgi:Secretion system C-terminal sorting domain
MKTLFLYFLTSISIFNVSAQITVTNATFPKIGDTLKTVVSFDFEGNLPLGTTGGPKVWDFSMLNGGINQREIYLHPSEGKDASSFPEATMLLISDGQEIYLKSSATKLEGLGFGGANQFFDAPLVVKYSKRPVLRTAPLEFINNTSSTGEFRIDISSNIIPDTLLASLPIKPDSIRIQFSNEIKGLTDAFGNLKIQGQNFDVLRQKVENISQTQLFIKIFGIWIDPLPLLGGNIPGGFGDFLGKDTTITYNFISNTKKEILVSVDYNMSSELQSVTFADLGGVISSVQDIPFPDIKVYPNPVSDMLTFTTSDLPDGKYFITVSDIQGKIVYFDTATLRNNENKQINTTAFRDGMYVLTLRNQNNSLNSSIKFVVR